MLKRKIKKIVAIKNLNLAILYYRTGKVEKFSLCPGIVEQARAEGILVEN